MPLLRDVVRTTPPADLRERTLAFVRERGRSRAARPSRPPTAVRLDAGRPIPVAGDAAGRRRRGPRRGDRSPVASCRGSRRSPPRSSSRSWRSTLIVGARVDEQLAAQDRAIAGLEAVTSATLAITAEPDAERVVARLDGRLADATGRCCSRPSTTELVVVADGLTEPPDGPGVPLLAARRRDAQDVGKMFFADDLAFWVGDTPAVATISDGTTFGVSLTERRRALARRRPGHRRASSEGLGRGSPARSVAPVGGIGGSTGRRRSVGRRRRRAAAPRDSAGGARGAASAASGGTSQPSSAEGRRQPGRLARRARAASTSASRRRDSRTTNQTSPAPTTSPTMSSHQLNSAFTAAKYRERRRVAAGAAWSEAVARLHSAGCSTPRPIRSPSPSARSASAGTGWATPSGWRPSTCCSSGWPGVAGEDEDVAGNGIIIVAIAALIGGRLYHVIDQWELYAGDPIKIILPPYSGLGVYGGIITGTLAAWWYARRRGVPFARWADIVAPTLFVMQAIGRWGNYFNQELYGPPTTLPWGIPIDCAHRLAVYACTVLPETTRFHPLFLYESISGILGALFLIWLGFKARERLRPGDLLLIFFIWYGTTRFLLETLREANWLFFGVPTAQLVSLAFIVVGIAGLLHRHRPRPRARTRRPTYPDARDVGRASGRPTGGPSPIDEPWAHAGDLSGGSIADKDPAELGIGEPEPDDDDGGRARRRLGARRRGARRAATAAPTPAPDAETRPAT